MAELAKFCVLKEIGVEEHDGDVRFKSGSGNMAVSCSAIAAMHPVIIIGTVRSLWNWLWDRYHVSQNVFLVFLSYHFASAIKESATEAICSQVVCQSVRCPSIVPLAPLSRDAISLLRSKRISTKLDSNVHHLTGRCLKVSKLRG